MIDKNLKVVYFYDNPYTTNSLSYSDEIKKMIKQDESSYKKSIKLIFNGLISKVDLYLNMIENNYVSFTKKIDLIIVDRAALESKSLIKYLEQKIEEGIPIIFMTWDLKEWCTINEINEYFYMGLHGYDNIIETKKKLSEYLNKIF